MIIKTRRIRSLFVTMLVTLLCLLSLHSWMPSIAQIKPISFLQIDTQKQLSSPYILAEKSLKNQAKKEENAQESSSENSVNKNQSHPVTLDGETIFEYRVQLE